MMRGGIVLSQMIIVIEDYDHHHRPGPEKGVKGKPVERFCRELVLQ